MYPAGRRSGPAPRRAAQGKACGESGSLWLCGGAPPKRIGKSAAQMDSLDVMMAARTNGLCSWVGGSASACITPLGWKAVEGRLETLQAAVELGFEWDAKECLALTRYPTESDLWEGNFEVEAWILDRQHRHRTPRTCDRTNPFAGQG